MIEREVVEAPHLYKDMMDLCKKAISQSQDIIYSDDKLEVPTELFKNK